MTDTIQNSIRLIKTCHRGGHWGMFWEGKTKLSSWYEIGKPAHFTVKADVYFGVSPSAQIPPTNGDGKPAEQCCIATQNNYIGAVNCLYSEYDGKDFSGGKEEALDKIEQLPVYPSVIVDSGGGYHAYWFFEQPVMIDNDETRANMIVAQMQWVSLTGGDKGAKDLRRVLRVPGTWNAKYSPFREVVFVETNWQEYDSTTIISFCSSRCEAIRKSAPLGRIGNIAVTRGSGLIERFNADNPPGKILEAHGYSLSPSGEKFTRPGKKSSAGISGTVKEWNGKETIYSWSSNDPLFCGEDGHRIDSFDAYVKLEHGGDVSAALKAVKEMYRP